MLISYNGPFLRFWPVPRSFHSSMLT
ncbi:hypothetical protein F383_36444 [Gossypium arboreum]|uniref:Uncharacterized protein n=1 Tax=Gossypium arboreum TaxID=29729 RepID=A0A0B0N985_GOSAR|nr:hypothetical protein F383_36444 [Gossypium arboreum]